MREYGDELWDRMRPTVVIAIGGTAIWAFFLGLMFGGILTDSPDVQWWGTIGVLVLALGGTVGLAWSVHRNPPPPVHVPTDSRLDYCVCGDSWPCDATLNPPD